MTSATEQGMCRAGSRDRAGLVHVWFASALDSAAPSEHAVLLFTVAATPLALQGVKSPAQVDM